MRDGADIGVFDPGVNQMYKLLTQLARSEKQKGVRIDGLPLLLELEGRRALRADLCRPFIELAHGWGVGEDEEGRPVHMLTFDRNPLIFADVGGHRLWKLLLDKLR